MTHFKTIVLVGLGIFVFLSCPVLAAGEGDFPSKPITIHVGMAPGAFAGIGAHIFSQGAQKYLPKPQPIFVNYKTGAGGMMAVDGFTKLPADGHNIMWVIGENIWRLSLEAEKFSFRKEDFLFLGTVCIAPLILVVHKDSPFKTFEDFIDYAKKNPDTLTIGTSGLRGTTHLATEVLIQKTGVQLTHVPFPGGAPATLAVLGRHVTCYIGSPPTLGAHIKPGGNLRCLAVLYPNRCPQLPDVPTCLEKGYDVGRCQAAGYLALKKGTPKGVFNIWVKIFEQTLSDPTIKTAILGAEMTPSGLGPGETEELLNEEVKRALQVFSK